MEELSVISREEPGIASIVNFGELKYALEQQLSNFDGVAYPQDATGVKAAKADKAMLNKLKKSIDDKRKEIKRVYMEPYLTVEAQAKELIALIELPLAQINEFILEDDLRIKAQRRNEVTAFYHSKAAPLGELAELVLQSPSFYDKKWDNKSTTAKIYQEAVSEKIHKVVTDIATLKSSGGMHTTALLEKYLVTLSMEGLADYKRELEQAERVTASTSAIPLEKSSHVTGYKVLKLTGGIEEMAQIMEQLELMGIEVEELEDGMPQGMVEKPAPDFSSFVAFDIETTGTWGAANGDAPAEITEIGAVKVENGEIVARFSMLANPNRSILPRIARITGITDEMVRNEPSIDQVIRLFYEFVGDSVLVGHNIKSCDIPYINRTASRNGFAFENTFFDTYCYARQYRKTQGWESLKLGYLSNQFGITLKDAHRAWADAEANVGVYFKLKDME